MYGVDRRTVTNWLNEDPACPSKQGKAGRAREFDTAAVARWYGDRAARKAVKEHESQRPASTINIADEEARKAKADADIAEMKRDQMRGELVPIAEFRRVVERLCGLLRA